MPWHIEKRQGEFCVIKNDDGENEGCHETEAEAKKQMAALYASENRFASEVEVRSATITGVRFKERLIDLVAVPWEQEAEVMVHGEMWREVFTRGAFKGIEEHAGRVRVNREHTHGDTVGKVVQFTDTDDGLQARVKVAQTPRGEETLALADEDMISASVGYRIQRGSDVESNRRTRLRRVKRAFLDHLSMVESPAYKGAGVLRVAKSSPGEPRKRIVTPALDEVLNDEVFVWARQRLEDPGAQG